MATRITGINNAIFWAIEPTFLYTGGMPVTGTAVHQPFNPIEERIDLPYPLYKDKEVYTNESLLPDNNLSFTEKLEPGSKTFPNSKGMIYHDPMLMCALVFSHKTVTGSWSAGASTYGKITGDFSAFDDLDTIMVQYTKKDDGSTIQFDKTLVGGVANQFSIGFDKGDLLRTKYELMFPYQVNNTRAYSAVANFDNGTWADWAKSTYYHATDCKVYWDDSHVAEFTDINVYSCWFIFEIPKEYNYDNANLYPFTFNLQDMKFRAEIMGNVKGDTELDELDSIRSSRTKKDLRLSWDQTVNETKFIDISNAHVIDIDSRYLPSASEKYEVTLTFAGTNADFEGNYENLPDPSARIST